MKMIIMCRIYLLLLLVQEWYSSPDCVAQIEHDWALSVCFRTFNQGDEQLQLLVLYESNVLIPKIRWSSPSNDRRLSVVPRCWPIRTHTHTYPFYAYLSLFESAVHLSYLWIIIFPIKITIIWGRDHFCIQSQLIWDITWLVKYWLAVGYRS